MARTSAFFGSVMPKAFCQKRLKLSFPAPFFFGSFLFGRTKRNQPFFLKYAICPRDILIWFGSFRVRTYEKISKDLIPFPVLYSIA